MEFYRLNEDLPEHGLFRGDVGCWEGTYLQDPPMTYQMTFRWAGRYKLCWVQRQKLYSVEQPFDWFGVPSLRLPAQIMLSQNRIVIWRDRGKSTAIVYKGFSNASLGRLARFLSGRPCAIRQHFDVLYHIYEV